MKHMKSILSLSLLFTLISCGNGKGKVTKTNFVFSSAIANIGGQTGGIMVFGENRATGQSIRFVLSNEPIELENGVWDFLYSSWDGAHAGLGTSSNQLEGALRCGQSIGINLSGAETPVTMVLSSAGCASPYFGAASTKDASGNPKPVDFYGCSNNDVFDEEDEGEVSDCLFSAGDSFQVFLPELLPNGSVRLGLQSRCIENTNVFPTALMNNTINHDIKIPMYLPVIGSPIIGVRIFEGDSCDTLVSETRIRHLYAGEHAGSPFELDDDQAEATNSLMVKVNVCDTAKGILTVPFEFDSGKYSICTKDQFAFLNSASNNTFQYFLDKDIDFGGDTITGHVITTLDTSGLIEGQGHRISNFNLVDDGSAATGFVSVSSGKIRNLRIEDVTVTCTAETTGTGALIGSTLTLGEVENISLENINISSTGCERVGGLIGSAAGTSPNFFYGKFINAKDITIDIDDTSSNYIGGLVGFAGLRNSFHHLGLENISINSIGAQSSTVENVGGVFGALTEDMTNVTDVIARNISLGSPGTPLLNKSKVGLFVGSTGGPSVSGPYISSVKVEGSIDISTGSQFIGGITGRSYATDLSNLVADVDLSAAGLTDVGGIAGNLESNSFASSTLSEARVSGVIECGGNCAGIVGFFNELTSPLSMSKAYCSADIIANGGNSIGGIVGGVYNGDLNQLQFVGDISGTSTKVGGIVGNVQGAADTSFSDIVSYGSVAGADEVGGVAGSVDFANVASFSFILTNGDVTSGGTFKAYDFGKTISAASITNCFAVDNDGGGPLAVSGDCTSTSAANMEDLTIIASGFPANNSFFDGEGNVLSELVFANELSQLSGLGKLGNFQDPFELNSKENWNLIGDSAFLMNKAFRLASDIDFGSVNGDFKPIGSTTNPFKGHLFGNNHSLMNIYYRESVSLEPIGIFRVIEADQARSPSIQDINKGDEGHRRLYIENAHFEYDGGGNNVAIGTLAGVVKDFNDGANQNGINIGGITVNGADVITDSTDGTVGTSGAGGLIGSLQIGSERTIIEQIILNDITVDTTATSAVRGSGGMIGNVSKDPDIGANSAKIEGSQVYGVVVDGGTDSNSVGGFIGVAVNDRINYEDIIMRDVTLNGSNSVGGFMGLGNFAVINGVSIRGVDATASANEVGGFLGMKGAGSTLIKGSYVIADSLVGADEVACLAGDLSAGGMTVENSYFICPNLTGTTTSHFSLSALTIGASASVFYVAPSSEGVTTAVHLPDDSTLRSPATMISSFPNFINLDPWVLKDGELPTTVAEEFPEYFFY